MLAGPGVLMGAYIMGVVVNYLLPASYGWSWNLCMTFGAILSATDPGNQYHTLLHAHPSLYAHHYILITLCTLLHTHWYTYYYTHNSTHHYI